MLRGLRFGIDLSGNMVSPAYQQAVMVRVTLTNNGGTSAQFSLTGNLYRSGDVAKSGSPQGSFFTAKGGSVKTVSDTVPAGNSVVVILYSGLIAYAGAIDWSGVAAAGVGILEAAFALTVAGQTIQYVVPDAVRMPSSPANIQVSGVTFSLS